MAHQQSGPGRAGSGTNNENINAQPPWIRGYGIPLGIPFAFIPIPGSTRKYAVAGSSRRGGNALTAKGVAPLPELPVLAAALDL